MWKLEIKERIFRNKDFAIKNSAEVQTFLHECGLFWRGENHKSIKHLSWRYVGCTGGDIQNHKFGGWSRTNPKRIVIDFNKSCIQL